MKEKVAVFTEKRECSDLFAIAENKYRTEVSLYKDKKIVQEAGLEPARYCYHRHLKPCLLYTSDWILKLALNALKVLPDPGGNPCRCALTVGES